MGESLFRLVGFQDVSDNLLKLNIVPPLEILQYIAFECFMASVECCIIDEIYNRVKKLGVHIQEVVKVRLETQGSVDHLVNLIESRHSAPTLPQNRNSADGVSLARGGISKKSIPGVNDLSREMPKKVSGDKSMDVFRNKLQKHIEVLGVDSERIPFMDEEIEELKDKPVDLDEHLMASLRCLEGKEENQAEKRVDTNVALKPSQEWAFVSDKLEQQYGPQYFSGQRADILQSSPCQNVSSSKGPYVKIQAVEAPTNVYVNKVAQQYHERNLGVLTTQQSDNLSPFHDSDYGTVSNSSYLMPSNQPPHHLQTQSEVHARQIPASQIGRQYHTETIAKRTSAPAVMGPPLQIHTPPTLDGSSNFYLYQQQQQQPQQLQQQIPQSYRNITVDNQPANIQALSKRGNASLLQNRMSPMSQSGIQNRQQLMGASMSRSFTEPHQRRPGSSQAPLAKTIHTSCPTVNTNQWSCVYCTYINDNSSNVCTICYKSRDVVDTDSSPIVGQVSRVCSQCTLENEANELQCHACGQELKRLHTAV